MSSSIVCGIDPGTAQTALVIWDGTRIHDRCIIPNIEVLAYLVKAYDAGCALVSCEHMQSFGMAVGKEVFETCYWIGRFEQVCWNLDLKWRRVYRSEVKAHWCHSTKANDSNIRAAVIDRLGPPGTKKVPGITYGVSKDMWSALAIAVRALDLK